MQPTNVNVLPNELLRLCFRDLSARDTANVRAVCKRWQQSVDAIVQMFHNRAVAHQSLPTEYVNDLTLVSMLVSVTGLQTPLIQLDLSACLVARRCKSVPTVVNHIPASVIDLDLTDCELSANAVGAIKVHVVNLNLTRCPVNAAIMSCLKTTIYRLNLSHCGVSEQDLTALGQAATGLGELNMSGCRLVTYQRHQFTSLPMTVATNPLICTPVLRAVPPSVTKINLSGCQVTGPSLRAIPATVEEVDLSDCTNMDDEDVQAAIDEMAHRGVLVTQTYIP